MSQEPKFIVHDSNGLHVWTVNGKLLQTKLFNDNDGNNDRPLNIKSSNDGQLFAIIFKTNVKIYKYEQNFQDKPFIEFPIENVKHVKFSPKSSMIMLYVTPSLQSTVPNLKIFDLNNNGQLIHEWISKKLEFIEWSSDETISMRQCGSEILFFENNYDKCLHKLSQQKLTTYSFVTNNAGCSFVAIYIKGQKSSPSQIRIHGYPYLQNAIVSKSFYKVDTVDIKWNPKGDAILAQTSTDYDSTGQSYYGETMLHFMDLRGETFTVLGKKEGTVSAAEWLPNNNGFIVIQGKMPALVTWYSNRCEPIHSFGELPVNGIRFNRFGTLLALTGFGNLSGNVYIFNLKTKTLISNFKAIDTTCYHWLSDGLHLLTATHYDRLKVCNGFRCWNYLGTLLHQYGCNDDNNKDNDGKEIQLYQIQPYNIDDEFSEPILQADVKGKIMCEEPAKKYVPPSLRNKDQSTASRAPPPPPLSKSTIKSIQKQKQIVSNNKDNGKDSKENKMKKLKNLKKKLQQINQLKKLQDEGKELEKNQLTKIEKMNDIIKEIELLQMN